MKTEYTFGRSRHPALCRWWLSARKVPKHPIEPAGMPCFKLVVPFWAWPLELLHRAVFGKAKIIAVEAEVFNS